MFSFGTCKPANLIKNLNCTFKYFRDAVNIINYTNVSRFVTTDAKGYCIENIIVVMISIVKARCTQIYLLGMCCFFITNISKL